MSSKRKHNHNATAEVECLEIKTNNETDKQCFSAYLLNFFLFSSGPPICSDNVAILALDCSLLRFKPFLLITYDRSDFSSAPSACIRMLHRPSWQKHFLIVLPLFSIYRCHSKVVVAAYQFRCYLSFFFLRFKMELIFQMWTFKGSYHWIFYRDGIWL